MRKTILAAILLTATMARAQVAIHTNDLDCYEYDSTGAAIVEGAGRLTYSVKSGVGTWQCEVDQGFPAGHVIRLDAASTGQPCGVWNGTSVVFSNLWRETISASGRIVITCTVPPQ